MPRGIPNSGHRKAKGPRKFGPDKKPGPKPKAKPPEEQKILKGYRATPIEHTRLSACLKAMREEAGAGKDKEQE